jgi:hypothetical protein
MICTEKSPGLRGSPETRRSAAIGGRLDPEDSGINWLMSIILQLVGAVTRDVDRSTYGSSVLSSTPIHFPLAALALGHRGKPRRCARAVERGTWTRPRCRAGGGSLVHEASVPGRDGQTATANGSRSSGRHVGLGTSGGEDRPRRCRPDGGRGSDTEQRRSTRSPDGSEFWPWPQARTAAVTARMPGTSDRRRRSQRHGQHEEEVPPRDRRAAGQRT